MTNWDEDREVALLDELVALPWVEFVYLFGSTARGEARPHSDVDIAVKLGHGPPPSPLFQLLAAGNRAVGAGVLHLVVFDHAPVVLRQRVFEEGRLLLERNPVIRMAAQASTMRDVYNMTALERAEQEHWAQLETDPESASRRLAMLMQYRKEVTPFSQMDEADFVAARAKHHLAERYLHLVAEGILDLILWVLVKNDWRSPTSPLDALNVLREQQAIDFSLADRLQDWMLLRRMLMHRFHDPDHELAFKHLQRLFEVDEFCQWVAARPEGPGAIAGGSAL